MKLAIIDYGMGNIRSVCNAFKYLGAEPVIVNDPSKLNADKIVIPGVGAFGDGVKNLKPFFPKIKDTLNSDIPVLGICLGMHMLFESSEELPRAKGLEVLKGRAMKIRTKLRLPHIGWNSIDIKKKSCPIFKGLSGGHVYFVHSYHVLPKDDIVAATTQYGCEVTAGVWKDNIYGTQFHPEKSGDTGLKMLENFMRL